MKGQNRTAFFNILSTVLLNGISIFTSPLFSRMLGDSNYGVVSVYSTWVYLVAILFSLQTYQTLVHARSEFPEAEQKSYQSAVMSLSCMVFMVCAAAVIIFLGPISSLLKLEKGIVLLILLQAFGTYCVNFVNNKFTYEFKAGYNFAISMVTTIFTVVLSIVLIRIFPEDINYYGRILALAITYGILGSVFCVYILAKGKTFFRKEYWNFCVPLALPLIFQCLSDLLLGQSDRIVIQQMGTDAMVGHYSLASNFVSVIYSVFVALNNSWCPFFYENMRHHNRDNVQKLSRNYLELYTVLAMGFMLLAKEVYHVFASEEFWAGTELIPILTASYYIVFLTALPSAYELHHRKVKVGAVLVALATIINVVLNYFLIRAMGIVGAAVATAISHAIQFLLHQIFASRIQQKGEYPFPFKLLAPYILSFFAVCAVVVLVWETWWVRWVVGAALGIWEVYRIYKRKTIL